MNQQEALIDYVIRLADNGLILGQRLGEWCGHGPILEQDIAITNIALDHIGQARTYFQYAAELMGPSFDEDKIAYLRTVEEYRNYLLLEQPNEDWAYTLVRSFLYDAFHYLLLQQLQHSTDERIGAIAEKALKEVTYHRRYSSEWVIRLGDGTNESHRRMQNAVDDLWMFSGEFFELNDTDRIMIEEGIGTDPSALREAWTQFVQGVLVEATLTPPATAAFQTGGKNGLHTEHLGYILSDLQYMQRTYPGMAW